MTDSEFREAYSALVKDVATSISMEDALSGRAASKRPKGGKKRSRDPDSERPLPCRDVANRVLKACREARARKLAVTTPEDISDAALSRAARFTDKFALKSYEPFLHYVPRLVNVVTVRSPRPLPPGRPHPRPARSSPRPSPPPAPASPSPSTSTTSPRAARTPSTRPRSSPPSSWPTRSPAAASWSFVRAHALELRVAKR